jgi:FkbM family methyltransferase
LLNRKFIREVGVLRWVWRTAVRQLYKRVLRRKQRMLLPTGEWMTLPATSRFASEAYITGANVDWGSERLLDALLLGEGTFLDVGANIGYYSLYFLPRASSVYSFEPDPRVRVSLNANVRGKTKIEVIPWAVGARVGRARFVLDSNEERSHLSGESEAQEGIDVEVTTIDAFVAARGLRVEAIKVDAEGHDAEVIAGALRTLREQTPVVLTEAEPDAELFRLTGDVGYRVFAYVRAPETRRRSFAELKSGVAPPGETKMLFLIPQAMAEEIKRSAERIASGV